MLPPFQDAFARVRCSFMAESKPALSSCEPLVVQDVVNKIERQAVCVVQLEGVLARKCERLPSGVPGGRRATERTPLQAFSDPLPSCAQKRRSSSSSTRFTRAAVSASSGYAPPISLRTAADISERKGEARAEHVRVAEGAANDFAQNVAATIVRGDHAIRNQECGGPRVVGNNAQRWLDLRVVPWLDVRSARAASLMSGSNKSVSKLLIFPCKTAASRSRPVPVSTEGLGRGFSLPLVSRLNCMKTRFQIST